MNKIKNEYLRFLGENKNKLKDDVIDISVIDNIINNNDINTINFLTVMVLTKKKNLVLLLNKLLRNVKINKNLVLLIDSMNVSISPYLLNMLIKYEEEYNVEPFKRKIDLNIVLDERRDMNRK